MHERRSVLAPGGMVVAPHALATAAGLEILQQGGNAVEAAIAAATTIAVVYPHMNAIGGDNFWLIYEASTGKVHALSACGQAGRQCTIEAYRAAGYSQELPRRGPLAALTVPGAPDGWAEAHAFSREHLDGQRSLADLLARAIGYAANGFPVTPGQEAWTRRNVGPESGPFGQLERFKGFRRAFLRDDGTPYDAGELMRLPELAVTLQVIADEGRDAFYVGPIAELITLHLCGQGGLLTEEDFAAYRSRWDAPLSVGYRDWTLYNTPPPTQGLTSLQILKIAERFPFQRWTDGDADYYHVLIEATKQAFVDRDAWIADPDAVRIPLEELLSERRAAERASAIDAAMAAPPPNARAVGGDTVWFGAIDAAGNAVSCIQSTYFDFGSGVIPPGTGVVLQNRGSSFSLDPRHPNALAPGKRPFHTLNPAMALRDGRPELIYGTMGGEGQPQTQAALATRILDRGMGVQEAIDAPRWLYGRTWGERHERLLVERRVDPRVLDELRRRGHDVVLADAWDDRMGHAQAIWIDPRTGVRHGGADPRGDGIAAGV
ncbi:MAG TPA: gamma-glutamyltransferase [Candidatus Dormibacteraeota bacterium]|nr:gamma-glutamyltransferase [Candidatus Dormibacteraeota bacterium]